MTFSLWWWARTCRSELKKYWGCLSGRLITRRCLRRLLASWGKRCRGPSGFGLFWRVYTGGWGLDRARRRGEVPVFQGSRLSAAVDSSEGQTPACVLKMSGFKLCSITCCLLHVVGRISVFFRCVVAHKARPGCSRFETPSPISKKMEQFMYLGWERYVARTQRRYFFSFVICYPEG